MCFLALKREPLEAAYIGWRGFVMGITGRSWSSISVCCARRSPPWRQRGHVAPSVSDLIAAIVDLGAND
jgi:ribosome modulation factor